MPRVQQMQLAARVHDPALPLAGVRQLPGVQLFGQPRLGQRKVELRQPRDGIDDDVGGLADQAAQLAQDALHLALLLQLELAPLVADLDD